MLMRNRVVMRAVILGTGLATLLVLGWLIASGAIVWAAMDPAHRVILRQVLAPQLPLLALALLLLMLLTSVVVHRLYRRLVQMPERILEQARALVDASQDHELAVSLEPRQQALIETINALVRQRNDLRRDVRQQVDAAARQLEQERNRLAALMSELAQGVIACNLDGRVLLYNNRARLQVRALSGAPSLADGAELIGLGKSIHAVLDRRLVSHALASVMQRLRRGADSPVATFVTMTGAGQSLRVQLAPVRDAADAVPDIGGYVLLIENVTAQFEGQRRREQLLSQLIDHLRDSVTNLHLAANALGDAHQEGSGTNADRRAGLMRIVDEHSQRIEDAVNTALAARQQESGGHWPLEELLGAELLEAALHRIDAAGARAKIIDAPTEIWLKADSFGLLQAIEALSARLVSEHGVSEIGLRLRAGDQHAQFDLCWPRDDSNALNLERWEDMPIADQQGLAPMTVREIVERHHSGIGFELEPATGLACLRFTLPIVPAGPNLEPGIFLHGQSRPEFYDFELFATSEQVSTLDQQPLTQLSFTVFDTETTGLEPSAGDEIIQIGAVRIVNGRLLRSEAFEQLVDPRRPIPRASTPIHGIEPQMLVGKPVIDEVLPAFHAYAQDTVLVAHNAAFDLRFLQLKEQRTGIEFSQPVLDTLLLSAFVQPNQDSHRLEAIAERFGIPVIGRHTALGDAIVTAEVLLRLIPLLAARGIHTLAQARQASRKTWYARLRY